MASEGHYGALCRVVESARAGGPLTVEQICDWQRLLVEEQRSFGHAVPATFAGQLRGATLPVNVRVGSHFAPSFADVEGLVHEWTTDLNRWVSGWRPFAVEDVDLAATLGSLFQRFEAIHPFGDGNGRTGRLVVGYLCARAEVPLVVVRATERPGFYAAHNTKLAMQLFMAEKIRERVRWLDGSILRRTEQYDLADRYAGMDGEPRLIVERHALVKAATAWREQLAAK